MLDTLLMGATVDVARAGWQVAFRCLGALADEVEIRPVHFVDPFRFGSRRTPPRLFQLLRINVAVFKIVAGQTLRWNRRVDGEPTDTSLGQPTAVAATMLVTIVIPRETSRPSSNRHGRRVTSTSSG